MSLSQPFTLESYVSEYSGETILDRLYFIASQNGDFKIDSLKLLIDTLKTTKNIKRYNKVYDSFESDISAFGDDYAFDSNWANELDSKLKENINRYDSEVASSKSRPNSIDAKNDLRNAYASLGHIYFESGDFSLSLQSFNRIRDTTMDQKHTLEMLKNMVKVSHFTRNTTNVSNCVDQALSLNICNPLEIYELKCYDALANLYNQNFNRATNKFLELDFNNIPEDINRITTVKDISIYVGVCALAEFGRPELQSKILQNPNFQLYLESNEEVETMLKDFYDSKYGQCLEKLEKLRVRLENDVFIRKSVDQLYDKIRKKSIINYFTPYEAVDLSTMAEMFLVDIPSLEKELMKLIVNGDIRARIDSHRKKLVANQDDLRTSTFDDAMKLGETFHKNVRYMLVHANMRRHHFNVSLERPRKHDDFMVDYGMDLDFDPGYMS